jgi:hypothetical protein
VHVDTSVSIDLLRGHPEEDATRLLLSALIWHAVHAKVAEEAGARGRQWLDSHHTIDRADLAIAAIQAQPVAPSRHW